MLLKCRLKVTHKLSTSHCTTLGNSLKADSHASSQVVRMNKSRCQRESSTPNRSTTGVARSLTAAAGARVKRGESGRDATATRAEVKVAGRQNRAIYSGRVGQTSEVAPGTGENKEPKAACQRCEPAA